MVDDLQRTTFYLDPALHKALKMKAAESGHSMSEFVNQAIRLSLAEDAVDLDAIDKRTKQPDRGFDSFVKELRKNGLI